MARKETGKRGETPKEHFALRVYEIVRKCPRGKVVSYGGVAGSWATVASRRGVGLALKLLESDTDVPWWWAVNAGERSRCATVRARYFSENCSSAKA